MTEASSFHSNISSMSNAESAISAAGEKSRPWERSARNRRRRARFARTLSHSISFSQASMVSVQRARLSGSRSRKAVLQIQFK